jgi:flagellar basal-body rod protein FlgB
MGQPEFKPSDLAPLNFDPATAGGLAPVALLRTSPAHLVSAEGGTDFRQQRGHDFEVVPTGNAVNLDDEMLKVAANQMEFQTGSALYTRGSG